MPIYEYRCADCGHELEALQRLADAPLTVCPACHKSALKKLVSAAGFQLKGSGWYVTDFRNSGAKPPKEKSAGGDAASNGNGSAATASDGAAHDTGAKQGDAKPADTKPAAATATPSKPAATTGSKSDT